MHNVISSCFFTREELLEGSRERGRCKRQCMGIVVGFFPSLLPFFFFSHFFDFLLMLSIYFADCVAVVRDWEWRDLWGLLVRYVYEVIKKWCFHVCCELSCVCSCARVVSVCVCVCIIGKLMGIQDSGGGWFITSTLFLWALLCKCSETSGFKVLFLYKEIQQKKVTRCLDFPQCLLLTH